MKKPELLSPAGGWGSVHSAVSAGADAVYFGVKGFNMRRSADNFDILELKKVMDVLRSSGKKGYLALNITVREGELARVERVLDEALRAAVDGVILWDLAVLSAAMERALKPHLSTQASVSNFEALKSFYAMGVKRFVLARECSFQDVREINKKILSSKMDVTLESFVHGAMCVSVSGRCFLSQHTFSRSANRGDCLQPCRREYRITDTENNGECDYVIGSDYVMSAKDLCCVAFIDKLMEAGISAFKIEGRMRPPEYVSLVTSVYREAIDAVVSGNFTPGLVGQLREKLKYTFNRGFTEGFFFGPPADLGASPSRKYEKEYVGKILKFYSSINVAEIIVQNRGLRKGDKLLVTGTKTPASFFEVKEMQIRHAFVDMAESGEAVGVKVPFRVRRNDKVFSWTDH